MYQTPLQDDIVAELEKGASTPSRIAAAISSKADYVRVVLLRLVDQGRARIAGWEDNGCTRGKRKAMRFELVVDFRQPQRSQP